jgi:acyl carrier protein
MQSLTGRVGLEAPNDRNVIEGVRAIIAKHLSIDVMSDDEELFAAGILDSLNLVRLISQVEKTFGVELPMSEVGLDSFRSLTAIGELIERRRALACGPGPSPDGTGCEQEIQVLLREKLSIVVDDVNLDLFQAGCLDSMLLVQLVLELETHFELVLPMQDLDIASFRTVASISKLIERRNRARAR